MSQYVVVFACDDISAHTLLKHTCRARKLTDEQRSALAAYLSVYKGTEGGIARLGLSSVSATNHPSVERAYRMLSSAWTEVS